MKLPSVLRCGLLSSLFVLACAAQDYFPLETGNQWVYRSGGTRVERPLLLEIARAGMFEDRTYYQLEGFPNGPHWLRINEEGSLVEWDSEQRQERLWYAFAAQEGTTYRTFLPACCGIARVVSRKAKVSLPLGEFTNALELTYPGVFQVGIEREYFLPGVGLVHRTENTGGPTIAVHDLIYARIGGNTVLAAAENGFRVALDRAVYPPGSQALVRLTLRHTRANPLRLVFPSSQQFDIVVLNEKGAEVYRWSSGRFFIQALTGVTVEGEKNWAGNVPLTGLPEGRYRVEAWLTTTGARAYAASASFEIGM
ncbi:MAG: hypothetical protein HY235_00375 [Acidobacteria bacterium]|nr:hypothetical protein [Acidobacteriota bacterium]